MVNVKWNITMKHLNWNIFKKIPIKCVLNVILSKRYKTIIAYQLKCAVLELYLEFDNTIDSSI